MELPRTQNLKLEFCDTRAESSPSLWEWLACLPLSVFFPCLIDEMVCDRWCIESIIFSTGCLSMTKGTLLCKHRVSQYLKYNECIVHCQLVLWWSFCLEIQSIWSSIFDVWWFNPEELHKMDRAWNSQTEAFIDYLRRKMVLGSSCQNEKNQEFFWLYIHKQQPDNYNTWENTSRSMNFILSYLK